MERLEELLQDRLRRVYVYARDVGRRRRVTRRGEEERGHAAIEEVRRGGHLSVSIEQDAHGRRSRPVAHRETRIVEPCRAGAHEDTRHLGA